jgi:hypothetical protein
MSAPLKRGTARRMGLRHPDPPRPPQTFAEWAAGVERAMERLKLTGFTIGQFDPRRSR